jgi:hypothetical protein
MVSVGDFPMKFDRRCAHHRMDWYPQACNWPGPDRMYRNASRAMMFGAGRMTATARADIGARLEARPISVGLGLRTDM